MYKDILHVLAKRLVYINPGFSPHLQLIFQHSFQTMPLEFETLFWCFFSPFAIVQKDISCVHVNIVFGLVGIPTFILPTSFYSLGVGRPRS